MGLHLIHTKKLCMPSPMQLWLHIKAQLVCNAHVCINTKAPRHINTVRNEEWSFILFISALFYISKNIHTHPFPLPPPPTPFTKFQNDLIRGWSIRVYFCNPGQRTYRVVNAWLWQSVTDHIKPWYVNCNNWGIIWNINF